MLALQWESLRERQKLTDEDLRTLDRERLRLSGMPANPPSYVRPLRPHAAARDIGLNSSIKAAECRFQQIDGEFWAHWCSSRAPHETYAQGLDSIKSDVADELASIWKGRSNETDRWFESTCQPEIEKALAALAKQRIAQAREVEIQHLQRSGRASDSTGKWRNLSPSDPRYKSWQLILGTMLRAESTADGNFIANFTAKGAEDAVLTLTEQKYDICGQAGMILAENIAKAQEVAELLTEVVEPTLAALDPVFQVCEQHGLSTAVLSKKARIRLLARMEHWKAQAFERGLKGELRVLTDVPREDSPSRGELLKPSQADAAEPSGNKSAGVVPTVVASEEQTRDVPATENPATGRVIPEWAADLDTPDGRKTAREGWKRHWTTAERKCTNGDLTETACSQKDSPFLNQWVNGTLRLKDPGRSTRVQAIERVLRDNTPPKWHPLAKQTPS
jgi:hypothetical protein